MAKKKARGIGYRNSKGITASTAGPYIPPDQAKGNAFWTLPDMYTSFEVLRKYVPGDCNTYKPPVIKELTDLLNTRILIGGLKDEKGVKEKIRQLFAILDTVLNLQTLSGVTWSNALGCNIVTAEENNVWDRVLLTYPDAAPFKNAGWVILDEMVLLHSSKAKGTHVCRPALGTQGPIDPTAPGPRPLPSSATPGASNNASTGLQSPPSGSNAAASAPETPRRARGPEEGNADTDVATATPHSAAPEEPAPAPPAGAATPPASAPSRKRSGSAAAPPSAKRRAADVMERSFERMAAVYKDSAAVLAEAIKPAVAVSPVRRRQALDVLTKKDGEWLGRAHRVQLGTMLEETKKADTYLHWDSVSDDDRMFWVRTTLGLPEPDN